MVGSVSGPGSTFKAFLGSAWDRVPLSNKIRVRVGSVQHIYGSLRVRVRIFGPVKTSSSDFASSTRECELPRTGGHKSSNSANGTAAYLITSVSSPTLYYNTTKYDIKHHCLFLFSCKHINSRKKLFQGTYIHYSEKTYYIKQRCLFSVSFKILIATKMWFMQGVHALQ